MVFRRSMFVKYYKLGITNWPFPILSFDIVKLLMPIKSIIQPYPQKVDSWNQFNLFITIEYLCCFVFITNLLCFSIIFYLFSTNNWARQFAFRNKSISRLTVFLCLEKTVESSANTKRISLGITSLMSLNFPVITE